MLEPTETQTKVLAFVTSRIREGIPPTLQEISTFFGWKNHMAATHHLLALEKKGFLKRTPGISRGITLVERPKSEIPARHG